MWVCEDVRDEKGDEEDVDKALEHAVQSVISPTNINTCCWYVLATQP